MLIRLPCTRLACLAVTVAFAGGALPWTGAAAQTAHAPRSKPPMQERRGDTGGQYRPGDIVCTKTGCRPLPPNCHAVNEENWEGPTGYQIILCP